MDTIDFIDIDAALKRVGGNMGLYKRLLNTFTSGDYSEKILSAFQNSDMEDADRQVHALKGVAANLSLIKLHNICIELEKMIKAGESDFTTILSEMKADYEKTLTLVRELIEAN